MKWTVIILVLLSTANTALAKNIRWYAPGYGILLGLGLDFPILKDEKRKQDKSSIFFDINYNIFHTAYFEQPEKEIKFISLSAGFSWHLPE